MAIWQCEFFILPKSDTYDLQYDRQYGNIKLFEDDKYWKKAKIKKEIFSEISHLLKPEKSWSNEMDLYGSENGNRLEVLFYANNIIESVTFRIDFRSEYEAVLRGIISLCEKNGFCIIDGSLKNLKLSFNAIKETINKSKNKEFFTELVRNSIIGDKNEPPIIEAVDDLKFKDD